MATAGYTNIGASTANTGTGSGVANPVGLLITIPVLGNITKITGYVNMTTTTKNLTCSLYAGSSGSRGALQATSTATSVTSTPAWIDFTFASPFSASVTTYWLQFSGYGGDGPGTTIGQIAFDTGGAANTAYSVNDGGTPVFNTSQYSIYATYTPTVTDGFTIALV